MASLEDLKSQISTYLDFQHLPPKPTWLSNFAATSRLQTPLVSLQKTALFRILATDLTLSLESSRVQTFPLDVASPQARERRISGPIVVQVLDVQDVGRSAWSQVEALEAQERGETTKGREIIRAVPEESAGGGAGAGGESGTVLGGGSAGPHKLLLQDAAGTKCFGIELENVNGIGLQMGIGAKLLLKDPVVARGVVLLRPAGVEVLGGRVEVWDKKWKSERKETLKRMAGSAGREDG